MPQGLCNTPATWQRFMNWILRKHVGKICHIYIDDITIFSVSRIKGLGARKAQGSPPRDPNISI